MKIQGLNLKSDASTNVNKTIKHDIKISTMSNQISGQGSYAKHKEIKSPILNNYICQEATDRVNTYEKTCIDLSLRKSYLREDYAIDKINRDFHITSNTEKVAK